MTLALRLIRLSSSLTPVTSPQYVQLSLLRLPAGMYCDCADGLSPWVLRVNDLCDRAPDFAKRNVKVIGISANGLDDHEKWVKDINEWGSESAPTAVEFPIVRSLFVGPVRTRLTTPIPSIDCRCRPENLSSL